MSVGMRIYWIYFYVVLCLLKLHKYIQIFTKSAKILNSKSLPHPRNQKPETKMETELKTDLQEAREIWVQSCKQNAPFELQKIYEKIYNDCVSIWNTYLCRTPSKSSEEDTALAAIELAAETDIFSKPREEAEEILLNEIIRLKNKMAFNTFVFHHQDTNLYEEFYREANNNLRDRIGSIHCALEAMFAVVADIADTDSDDVFPEMNLEVD